MAPAGMAPVAPPRRGAGLAWTAIALALVATITQPVVNGLLFGADSIQVYGLWTAVSGFIILFVSLVGLVLGIIGARLGAGVLGGIGIGANAIHILGYLGVFIQPLFYG